MDDSTSSSAAISAAQAVDGALSSESGFWEAVIIKVIACVIVAAVAYAVYRLIMVPIRKHLGTDESSKRGGSIFQNIIRVTVSAWAVCCWLDILFNIDMAGILGALGVVGIAVSLGAQQTIANVIGGIIVSLSNMVGIGDWIKLSGTKEARIVDTNWRRTTLEDEDGIAYAVPNSRMVSEIVEKRSPFFVIVTPFSLKRDTPNVAKLLVECEQVVLDRQIELGMDYEEKRPKANVESASFGTLQAEVKFYVNRDFDTRAVKRAVLPALIDYLQERGVLAEYDPAQTRDNASIANQ